MRCGAPRCSGTSISGCWASRILRAQGARGSSRTSPSGRSERWTNHRGPIIGVRSIRPKCTSRGQHPPDLCGLVIGSLCEAGGDRPVSPFSNAEFSARHVDEVLDALLLSPVRVTQRGELLCGRVLQRLVDGRMSFHYSVDY